ncbi:MAG: hypothetical protein KHY47_01380 [Prevotella sp.]|nr:hypothetical protein [Prevotella sp.]
MLFRPSGVLEGTEAHGRLICDNPSSPMFLLVLVDNEESDTLMCHEKFWISMGVIMSPDMVSQM